MMTTVPIILVIVVWLFILAPWLLRSQRPMSHTGEAFEETRVLFEGDSGSVAGRRKPRVGKDDVRPSSHADSEAAEAEYELVVADDASSEHGNGEPTTRGTHDDADVDAVAGTIDGEVVESADITEDNAVAADSEADADAAAASTAEDTETQTKATAAQRSQGLSAVDGDDAYEDEVVIVDDEPVKDSEDTEGEAERVEAAEAEVFTAPANASVAEDAYDHDETYVSPVDLLYPGAIDAEPSAAGKNGADSADTADAAEATGVVDGDAVAVPVSATVNDARGNDDTELSEEELAFAQRRLGRGGWDPVKEKEASATRYQRRQRTLIGLAAAVVLTVCLGIVLGGWAWWLAGIVGIITTVYLVALRSQVRREQDLLRRRVYHLRRARLGVRNAENPAESLPPNLRRPGALVLEIDDESPDFDYLPVYDEDDTDGGFDGPHSSSRQRRDDLAARRVS